MAPNEHGKRRTTNRGVWYNVPLLLNDAFERLKPAQYWNKLHIEVRRFIRYVIWATLFTVIIVLKKPTEIDFYLTDRVRYFLGDSYIGQTPYAPDELQYRDINSISDVWTWMEGSVVPTVYNTTVPNAFEGDMLGYNIVLGGIRMKQQKSRPVSCPAPPDAVIAVASVCFLEFDSDNLVTDPFGAVNQYRFYQSSDDGKGFKFKYWGQIDWYPSDGYIVDFGRNMTEVYLLLQQLQNDDWLDVSTRSVVVELSIYNPYLMTFSLGSFLMEMPPGPSFIVYVHARARICVHMGIQQHACPPARPSVSQSVRARVHVCSCMHACVCRRRCDHIVTLVDAADADRFAAIPPAPAGTRVPVHHLYAIPRL